MNMGTVHFDALVSVRMYFQKSIGKFALPVEAARFPLIPEGIKKLSETSLRKSEPKPST